MLKCFRQMSYKMQHFVIWNQWKLSVALHVSWSFATSHSYFVVPFQVISIMSSSNGTSTRTEWVSSSWNQVSWLLTGVQDWRAEGSGLEHNPWVQIFYIVNGLIRLGPDGKACLSSDCSKMSGPGHRFFFFCAVLLQGCSSCTQLRSVSSLPLYSWELVRDVGNSSTVTCSHLSAVLTPLWMCNLSFCRSCCGSNFVPFLLQQSGLAWYRLGPATLPQFSSALLISEWVAAVSGAAFPADGPLFLWCHSCVQPGSPSRFWMPD